VHPLAATPLEGHESNGSTPTDSSRRRRRTTAVVAVICVVALGAAAVAVGVAVAPGPSSTGTSGTSSGTAATRLLSQAVAATAAAGTFHYVAVSQGGNTNQTTVGAAGRASGSQRITFDSSAFGTERFSLVFVGGVVYFRGNAASIQDQLAVTSHTTAAAHAGRWIAVRHSDTPYAALAEGITARSALTQIVIRPHSIAAVHSADGRHIWRLSGDLPPQQGQGGAVTGTAHLDIAAATKLPLSYASTTSSGGQQGTSGFTFSRWGGPVTVTAPSSPVPYSSIALGSGAGGPTPTFST
jgi:hypothetical protein